MALHLGRLGGLPETLVIDREGALHAGAGRPTDAFAAFCGQLPVGWRFCEPGDPQAKGLVERLQGYIETSFEPGRAFANHHDFQDQLDRWFDGAPTAGCIARCGAGRSICWPTSARRCGRCPRRRLTASGAGCCGPARSAPRFDTNDYSLDPALVGRRVEVCVDQRQVTAVALDSGELACRHQRCLARHRTITALEHARALKAARAAPTRSIESRSGR